MLLANELPRKSVDRSLYAKFFRRSRWHDGLIPVVDTDTETFDTIDCDLIDVVAHYAVSSGRVSGVSVALGSKMFNHYREVSHTIGVGLSCTKSRNKSVIHFSDKFIGSDLDIFDFIICCSFLVEFISISRFAFELKSHYVFSLISNVLDFKYIGELFFSRLSHS